MTPEQIATCRQVIAVHSKSFARDVLEDWEWGRLYLPDTLLAECGAPDLRAAVGVPLPRAAQDALACAVRRLLAEADRFYASGDRGLPMLCWRAALSIRTARLVYSRIGRRIEQRGCDVFAGRQYVPLHAKLRLVTRATAEAAAEAPNRLRRGLHPAPLSHVVRFPNDVLPV